MSPRRESVPDAPRSARRRGSSAPDGRSGRLLAVLRCDGSRCAGLRQLEDERAEGSGSRIGLASAVRVCRGSVLVAVGCVGGCEHGAVVLVGTAVLTSGTTRLQLEHRPTVLVRTERPERAEALEGWLRSGPEDLSLLPIALALAVPHG